MDRRHSKTLAAIFSNPVPATLEGMAIERLLQSAGCRLIEASGSRVRFERDGLVATFHRPHTAKEAKKYQIRDAREYLTKLGVVPWMS